MPFRRVHSVGRKADLLRGVGKNLPLELVTDRHLAGVGPGQNISSLVGPFVCDAADFDGTSDFMLRGGALTGIKDTWRHILFSWDLANSVEQCYVTDVVTGPTVTTSLDSDLSLNADQWAVGARAYSNRANKLNGAVAEIWFDTTHIDLSVESNRRKFIGSDLKPVNLLSDGSGPTGSAPLVYLHLDNGEAVANFRLNRGDGGDFSITGTLETASTSPTD
jgi:hypothetical protein